MSRTLALVALCVLTLGLTSVAAAIPEAQQAGFSPARLFPDATFDPEIPTQESVIGFAHGARPLRHHELLTYLQQLADSSDRATIQEYARSHENRPMIVFVVSDEDVIADLETFRVAHEQRMDPRGRAGSEDSATLDGARAVAWLGYGIHGDELSSVDAAAAVAYRLVAGEDERSRRIREELVVLIDPAENPDGRDRYLALTAAFAHRTPNPDLDDLSHSTVWPWGRGNHYLFDLNRDWFSQVHPESTRTEWIARWNPQLMVDSHEMGANSSYLFSPPRHPFNPHLPNNNMKWADHFAADQARALDERGYGYFTREWNEEFFPGYGSSWAMYRGAVGILYEMSRTSGTHVKKRSGGTRSYPQAVEHQATSSLSNLTTLMDNRVEILADFVADRRAVIEQGKGGTIRGWVLPEGRHPERTRKLVDLLRRQGIEVQSNAAGGTVPGLVDGRTGGTVVPEAGTRLWWVGLDQPAGLLVRQLLDPHLPMDAAFFREEREHLERGKGTRLYETTGWSMPFNYGVDAYWTARAPQGSWNDDALPVDTGAFRDVNGAVVYVIDGTRDASRSALVDLLQRGIRTQMGEKPFRVGDVSYDRGAIVIPVEDNPDDLPDQLRQVAERWSTVIVGVDTFKAQAGPDLGGSHFRSLVEPRVAVLTGSPISPTSYGALWRLLDEDLALRFSGLDIGRFNSTDLDRYNVLVFPSSFGSYQAILGESGMDRLRRWIESGGTAIGIGNGATYLANESSGLTQTRLRSQALDKFPPVVLGIDAEDAQRAGGFRATGIRPPAPPKKPATGDSKKAAAPVAKVTRLSPYDVAPAIGAGAKPFTIGTPQGAAANPPVALGAWLKPYLADGKSAPSKEALAEADARLRRFAPRGVFLRIELDQQIWLNWGLGDSIPALINSRDTLVATQPVQVAARFAEVDQLHLGGLLWPEAAGRWAQTAYLTREGVGRGQVILFPNEPEFRGWTLGTRRLLVQAIVAGPGLGTRWSRPW
ncbi:MAG: M14 family zinc carboxypeptidase [Acidobacteriota bacterium]|nr:M14 family zinc carboxypeptidase [Acidobacteriota bacterium]MDH3785965.1 M14 family zinc carboxypeptidase [Acidobacteriota bacterium]